MTRRARYRTRQRVDALEVNVAARVLVERLGRVHAARQARESRTVFVPSRRLRAPVDPLVEHAAYLNEVIVAGRLDRGDGAP